MTKTIDPAALRVPALCHYVGLKRSAVYELLRSGQIRSFHVGRARLVLREDADKFLQVARAHTGNP